MRTAMILSLMFWFVAAVHGEDSDPIKSRFNKAKATFEHEVERARQAVLDDMDKREDAARKKPDLKAVNEIKSQREAFEISDDIQKYFTPESNRRLEPERKAFAAAYETAIKEYLRLKKDDEANRLDKEFKLIKVELSPTDPPKAAANANPTTLEQALLGYTWSWINVVPEPKPPLQRDKEIRFYNGGIVKSTMGEEWRWDAGGPETIYIQFNAKDPKQGIKISFDKLFSELIFMNKNGTPRIKGVRLALVAEPTTMAQAVDRGNVSIAPKPESVRPANSTAEETLTGRLYTSRSGAPLDNNEVYMYVDGTEGSVVKRQFDASMGRRVVRLFADAQFAFALRDGAEKRVRAKITGRFDGPNRLWVSSVFEIDRKPEFGLGRP